MAVKKVVEAEVVRISGEGSEAVYRLMATGGSFGRGHVFTFTGVEEVTALRDALAKVTPPVQKPEPKKPKPKAAPAKEEVKVESEEEPKDEKPKKVKKKKGKE
jgi:hypothetical protein